MALHANQRRLLEETFGAEVFERYGSEETSIIASECSEHRGMHVADEHLIVEVLDERGLPVGPGEEGEIVVTDSFNRVLPLIRYRLGDVGVRGEACPCGRGLSVLARVHGRVADNVVTPEGRTVSGSPSPTTSWRWRGSSRCKSCRRAWDELVFRIVRGEGFSEASEACLRGHCAVSSERRCGCGASSWRCWRLGPRGKYRLCISKLTEEHTP